MNNLILPLLVAFTCLLTVFSCQKDSVSNEINIPEKRLELMQFEDIEGFKTHFEKLEATYDDNLDKFGELVKENPLKTPYRTFLEDTFLDPAERYTMTLKDPIMNAIVNEYFEFQIDTVLLTSISNELILTSDIRNKEARNQIRLLPKGESINLRDLPEGVFPVTGDSFEDVLEPWTDSENYSIDKVEQSLRNSMVCRITGDTGFEWYSNSNYADEAMLYKTSSYKSWGRTKEEAVLYSYSRRLTGSWGLYPKFIIANIDADRRNNSCNVHDNEGETKSGENSAVSAKVGKWGTQSHLTGDVVGTFYKIGVDLRTQIVVY